MSQADIIDILFGIGILLLITLYGLFINKQEDQLNKRRENSVGEKYMQLMAVFMREFKGKLTDMSENSADMEVMSDDGKENLSIIQGEKGVSFKWTLSSGSAKLTREFKFADNEAQEEIMKVIAEGIIEAKKDNQL